ncbi:MAG TPA: M56 family metallopeptidase [Kofleriaceae bacterium]
MIAAKAILVTLAAVGAQGTLLALGALLVARAGRLRPGWQAAVWFVVVAKFAIPWGPALPYSLADLWHHGASPVVMFAGVAGAAPVAASASTLWGLALAVWILGALVVVGRTLVAHARTVVAARRAPLAPATARLLLGELAAQHRMRMPRLVLGAPGVGPHVVGVLRPVISVPAALVEDRGLLRAALLHELAHVRRFDGAAAILELAARAAFWCWPVVRLACRRLDASREAACDAWALSAADISRPAYARLLVRMAKLRVAAAPSLASPHALDARVAAVLGPECRRRIGAVHALALLAWIGVALGGARSAHAAKSGAVCRYSPQLAEALFAAHPEADLDGDGVLSVDEACELQAELQRLAADSEQVSRLPDADETLLENPLSCNPLAGAVNSAPEPVHVDACPVEGL